MRARLALLARHLRRGESMSEFLLTMVLFHVVLAGAMSVFVAQGATEFMARAYGEYGARFQKGMTSYAKANVLTLLAGTTTLSAAAIINSESDLMITTQAPFGAQPTLCTSVSGTDVSVYADIPIRSALASYAGVADRAVQSLGDRAGIVQSGTVMSPGGWHVDTSALCMPVANGDIVLRADYSQGS